MDINKFLSKLFGNKSTRDMKAIQPLVEKVKNAYPEIQALDNDALRAKTQEVKAYVQEPDKEQTVSRTMQLFTAFTNLVTRYHKREREVVYYANMLSITPDYLNKVCKMHWKTTAKEYIDWQVVMAIKNYLTCTDLSIKCIAAQLNFDDSSYMCRFFKKQTGMSPIQFRNSEM